MWQDTQSDTRSLLNHYPMSHREENSMKNKSDTFLVSFDYTHGDIPVLIVGRRGTEKEIDIVNAFKGDEAKELYQKLTKKVGI